MTWGRGTALLKKRTGCLAKAALLLEEPNTERGKLKVLHYFLEPKGKYKCQKMWHALPAVLAARFKSHIYNSSNDCLMLDIKGLTGLCMLINDSSVWHVHNIVQQYGLSIQNR